MNREVHVRFDGSGRGKVPPATLPVHSGRHYVTVIRIRQRDRLLQARQPFDACVLEGGIHVRETLLDLFGWDIRVSLSDGIDRLGDDPGGPQWSVKATLSDP